MGALSDEANDAYKSSAMVVIISVFLCVSCISVIKHNIGYYSYIVKVRYLMARR